MVKVTKIFHQKYLYHDSNYFVREKKDNLLEKKLEDIILKNLINSNNYKRLEESVWYYLSNDTSDFPNQGWKIHISATPVNKYDILDISSNYLIKHNISFKFLKNENAFFQLGNKLANRGSAGKFITIYPKNKEEFINILEDLYLLLYKYEGPYILSDKRYKDSKVLYYRYGGLKAITEINLRGEKEYLIYAPNGEKILDGRNPYFDVPYWEKDPFPQEELEGSSDNILNEKYLITDAIRFTPAGGIYKGIDLSTHKKIIVKEGRPYSTYTGNMDAISRIKNERKIYDLLKHENITPKYIDSFYEWEHYFLVIENLESINLTEYLNSINPLYSLNNDFEKYAKSLKILWINIAKSLQRLHKNKIVHGDISPNNILINKNDSKVNLIDFEVSFIEGHTSMLLDTPGFTNPKYNDFSRDIYSMICIFVSTLFPINSYLTLSETTFKLYLKSLVKDLNLSDYIYDLLVDLLFIKDLNNISIEYVINKIEEIKFYSTQKNNNEDINALNIQNKIQKQSQAILKSVYNNKFHIDPVCYVSNELNISHGKFGIIHSLLYTNSINANEAKKIIDKEDVNISNYPPGLYFGLAGLSWVQLEVGNIEEAENYLKHILKNINEIDSFDIFYGLSGIGLAFLKAYSVTKDIFWKNKAEYIAQKIIQNKKVDMNGNYYWINSTGPKHTGYVHGSTGISLFLLYLSELNNDKNMLKHAIKAIEFDLDKLITKGNNLYVSRNALESKEDVFSHYWIDGTAGILTGLIRVWFITKDSKYMDIIKNLSRDITRKYTFMPNLFQGLSGLCNTLLDIYQFTDDEKFLDNAKYVLSGISNNEISINDNVEFSGFQHYKLSHDFGYGSSGILCVYHRFINNSENFNFLLDDILTKKEV